MEDAAAGAAANRCSNDRSEVVEEVKSRKHRKLLFQSQQHQQPRQQQDDDDDGTPPHQLEPEAFARSYQVEALEKAMKGNTIAFLETGSGKTLIAIMLLRAHAHLLRRPSSSHIAVFLVPTVVLVNQQSDVIAMHTDLNVGRFWGEMGVDFWDASIWKEKLEQFQVFVMTPQILLNNLRHSFFKLDIIKLLVFDECHHAKGKHPYACIMTEFYHRELTSGSSTLPRVFGMTASLINSKGSSSRHVYEKQIAELESLMHSKVYTVVNESVLAEYITFSTTKMRFYKHEDIPYDLFVRLVDDMKILKEEHVQALQEQELDSSSEESAKKNISKLHATFLFCLSELGVWLALKAAESLSSRENDIYFWGHGWDGIGDRIVRKFSEDVFQLLSQYFTPGKSIEDDFGPAINAGLLTTKVDCLVQSLMEYRRVENLRCIIFVERVITAIVLKSLLCNVPKLSGWRTEYMSGNRSGLQSQTRSEHIKIVDAFREGKVNIIVATQILEEGLDVQSCNLVIRFDPSPTVCSFIQSRGRARMQGSDYLLLVRRGDSTTISRVKNYLNSGDIMREESLRQASFACTPLDSSLYNEIFYRVESTGAIVTLSSSIQLIYFYCSRMNSDRYFKPAPRFVMAQDSNSCTLYLPKSCPLPSVHVEGERSMLKEIVCLEACKKLHKLGALSDNLLPVSDMENESDGQENGDFSYPDTQPIFFPGELVEPWSSFRDLGLYHCYRVILNQNFDYDVTLKDILLVVKCDLGSEFAKTSFILEASRGSVTVNVEYAGTINLSPEQVSMCRRFQYLVLNILMHHDFTRVKDVVDHLYLEDFPGTVAYLLLPSIGTNQDFSIDWDCIKSALFSSEPFSCDNIQGISIQHHCSHEGGSRWIEMKNGAVCICMVQNSVVYTPHTGYFYCVTGIFDELNGHSTISMKGGNIMTYKKFYQLRHGITLSRANESLLVGRHLFKVQNFLLSRSFQEKESSNASVELPPELCVIVLSPITLSTLYSYSFVPSLMGRIESMLVAERLKKTQLDHCMHNDVVPTFKILEALTTKKCQEKFSLESLETLGDSFLKYAASLHLFSENKHHHEGLLSIKKNRMISNAFLCRLGCRLDLPGFIRNEEFDPMHWIVPGDGFGYFGNDEMIYSSSKNVFIRGRRFMKSKVVSDAVEALIGAYLSTGGEKAALFFMEWLGMNVNFNKGVPDDESFLSKPEMYINIKFLESLLKYTFCNPSLLVEALTHGSYQVADIPRCYQRLEFLGDAVLDHLITLHLYNKYPELSPGLLTDLRSASVNNDCYAHAAVKAGLNKHILHASPDLHKHITFYLNNYEHSFSGSSYGWEAGSALPKVLGDVIESIAGAIFVDSGFNKETVWESIRPLLEPIVTPETMEYHPVRELNELCSREKYQKRFSTTCNNGVASITAEVEVGGDTFSATCTAVNKNIAKKLAAKTVLKSLKAHVSKI